MNICMYGRANIDLAYASEQLICKIKQFYSKSPLQQSALILPQNSSCQVDTHITLMHIIQSKRSEPHTQ